MNPKDYYYNKFREQFTEWISKTNAHQHDDEGTFISIQSLNSQSLSHIPKQDLVNFYCALACTILIDQVMYTHFKSDYSKFQSLTQYPKIEYGISNLNVNPWIIVGSIVELTTVENFIEFFVQDLKDFFTEHSFEVASWDEVKAAMLNDSDCIKGPKGEILKTILEKQNS